MNILANLPKQTHGFASFFSAHKTGLAMLGQLRRGKNKACYEPGVIGRKCCKLTPRLWLKTHAIAFAAVSACMMKSDKYETFDAESCFLCVFCKGVCTFSDEDIAVYWVHPAAFLTFVEIRANICQWQGKISVNIYTDSDLIRSKLSKETILRPWV